MERGIQGRRLRRAGEQRLVLRVIGSCGMCAVDVGWSEVDVTCDERKCVQCRDVYNTLIQYTSHPYNSFLSFF